MTKQTNTNNLSYLIDPAFSRVNRLFVLLFENEEDRTYFLKHYKPKVNQIKDFNVLMNGKSFSDVLIKNKEKTYKKIIEIGKNKDCTTSNLSCYEYFSNHYKLIATN